MAYGTHHNLSEGLQQFELLLARMPLSFCGVPDEEILCPAECLLMEAVKQSVNMGKGVAPCSLHMHDAISGFVIFWRNLSISSHQPYWL